MEKGGESRDGIGRDGRRRGGGQYKKGGERRDGIGRDGRRREGTV